jgi:predicted phage tail protein
LGEADESYEILKLWTRGEYLTLSADDLRVGKWYVDASLAVHPDFKSHTGAVMILGKGAMQLIARKQKMNMQSSTEANWLQ